MNCVFSKNICPQKYSSAFRPHQKLLRFLRLDDYGKYLQSNLQISNLPMQHLFFQNLKSSLYLNALLHTLLYEVTYQMENTDFNSNFSLSTKIKRYLQINIHRNMSVTDVANHFGFSNDYVNRIFTRDEHISIKSYINQLKTERIEEYLSSTNTPFSMIAHKLGFSSIYSLSRFYKYHTGRTLTEYHSRFIN